MAEKKTRRNARKTEIRVKLEEPLDWGDETVCEVVITRPKGAHIKHLGEDSKIGDLVRVACKITGRPMAFYDAMDASDLNRVVEAVGELL